MPRSLAEIQAENEALGFRSVSSPSRQQFGWGDRLGAAVDSAQSSLYGIAEAAGSDWAAEQRRRNQAEAEYVRQRAAEDTNAPDSFRDVNWGNAHRYVGGLLVDSAPQLGAIAGAGLVAGPLGATSTAARAAAAYGASYPFALGDVLQSQRDQAGRTDGGVAAVLAAPYAAVDSLTGVGGAIGRGQLVRNSVRALDEARGVAGGLARTGASVARTGAVEGVGETFQEGMNQFGRMAVDPSETFYNPRSRERFLESAVGGAAMGGAFGLAGGWRRSRGYQPQPIQDGVPTDLTSRAASQSGDITREQDFTVLGEYREPVSRSMADLYTNNDPGADPYDTSGFKPGFQLDYAPPGAPRAPVEEQEPTVRGLAMPGQYDLFNPDGSATYAADPSFGLRPTDPPAPQKRPFSMVDFREQLGAPPAQTPPVARNPYAVPPPAQPLILPPHLNPTGQNQPFVLPPEIEAQVYAQAAAKANAGQPLNVIEQHILQTRNTAPRQTAGLALPSERGFRLDGGPTPQFDNIPGEPRPDFDLVPDDTTQMALDLQDSPAAQVPFELPPQARGPKGLMVGGPQQQLTTRDPELPPEHPYTRHIMPMVESLAAEGYLDAQQVEALLANHRWKNAKKLVDQALQAKKAADSMLESAAKMQEAKTPAPTAAAAPAPAPTAAPAPAPTAAPAPAPTAAPAPAPTAAPARRATKVDPEVRAQQLIDIIDTAKDALTYEQALDELNILMRDEAPEVGMEYLKAETANLGFQADWARSLERTGSAGYVAKRSVKEGISLVRTNQRKSEENPTLNGDLAPEAKETDAALRGLAGPVTPAEPAPAVPAAKRKAAPVAPPTQEVLEKALERVSEAKKKRLEKHYGADRGRLIFWQKLYDDVVTAINTGATSVAGAVRDIIKTVAAVVLSIGVVFNGVNLQPVHAAQLPTVSATTTEFRSEIRTEPPLDAIGAMSAEAINVYTAVAPRMRVLGKGFMVADKPGGMLHVFRADGSLLAQETALYGKDKGDTLGESSLNGGPKITPAGQFTLRESRAPYAGGISFDLVESVDADGAHVAVHAAWLGNAAENRAARFSETNPDNRRISFGCINTTHDMFLNQLLPNSSMFNGGMVFVLPDTTSAADMFPAMETTETRTTFQSTPAAPAAPDAPARDQDGVARDAERRAARARAGGRKTRSQLDEGSLLPVNPARTARIQAYANEIVSTWANRPEVIVLDSIEAAPQEILDEALASQEGATGVHHAIFVEPGRIYVFANTITDSAQAEAALFHEGLGHYGLRGVYGDAMVPVLDALIKARPDLIAAKAKQYNLDLKNEADRYEAADEVIAELAQTRPGLTWVQQLVAAVKTWLRENMRSFANMQLSTEEIIRDYVIPARNWVERGQGLNRAGQARAERALSQFGKDTVLSNGIRFERAGSIYSEAFKRWFGNSKAVDEKGAPQVWYHGTARDVTEFTPKQAQAIFLTRDPKFAGGFASASEHYVRTKGVAALTSEQRIKVADKVSRRISREYSRRSQWKVRDELQRSLGDFVSGRMPEGEVADYVMEAAAEYLDAGQNIMPLYVKAEKPFNYHDRAQVTAVTREVDRRKLALMSQSDLPAWAENRYDLRRSLSNAEQEIIDGNWSTIEHPLVQEVIRDLGYDSFFVREGGTDNLAVYNPTQVKSATGNIGTYDPNNPDIRYQRTSNTKTQAAEALEHVAEQLEEAAPAVARILRRRDVKEIADLIVEHDVRSHVKGEPDMDFWAEQLTGVTRAEDPTLGGEIRRFGKIEYSQARGPRDILKLTVDANATEEVNALVDPFIQLWDNFKEGKLPPAPEQPRWEDFSNEKDPFFHAKRMKNPAYAAADKAADKAFAGYNRAVTKVQAEFAAEYGMEPPFHEPDRTYGSAEDRVWSLIFATARAVGTREKGKADASKAQMQRSVNSAAGVPGRLGGRGIRFQRTSATAARKSMVDSFSDTPAGKTTLGRAVADALTNTSDTAFLLPALTNDQIAEGHKDKKAVGDINRATQRMAAIANRYMEDASQIVKRWRSLADYASKSMSEVMLQSTMSEMHVSITIPGTTKRLGVEEAWAHPSNNHLKRTPADREAFDKLYTQFHALPEPAKAIYDTVRKYFADLHEDTLRALRKSASDQYTGQLRRALTDAELAQLATADSATRATFKDLLTQGGSRLELRALEGLYQALKDIDKDFGTIRGPYFPLVRFGDHVVVMKSTGFRAMEDQAKALKSQLEAAVNALPATPDENTEVYEARVAELREQYNKLRKEIETAKQDEKKYVVEFHETQAEAQRALKQMQAAHPGANVYKSVREKYFRSLDGASPAFMKGLNDTMAAALDAGGEVSPDAKATALQAMRDMYLRRQPERSALRSELKRMTIEGAKSGQMLRGFAQSARNGAWRVSRLRHAGEITEGLAALSEDRGNEDSSHVLNELKTRFVGSLAAPEESKILRRAQAATYFWHLGFNVSYFMTNATQAWTTSLPVMAGRHGATNSANSLMAASKDVIKLLSSATAQSIKENGKIVGIQLRLTDDQIQSLGRDDAERRMLMRLTNDGVIDITIQHDLGAVSDGAAPGTVGRALQTTMEMSSALANYPELYNRLATALAAYRMELAKRDGADESTEQVQERAETYAETVINRTHFNYSPENAPRIMRGQLGRLVFQFKRYLQGMLYLYAKLIRDSYAGEGEARDDARRSLAYLLGMTTAVGGVSALPIAAPISFALGILASAYPDDDEPEWLQQWYNGMKDGVGETAAQALAKGLPAAAGVDLSTKLGHGNILNPVPFAKTAGKEGSGWWEAVLGAAAGPAAGLIGKGADAAVSVSDGHLMKAAEQAMPTFVANALKAYRRQADGETTKGGDTIMTADEFSLLATGVKFLGFETTKVSDTYDRRSAYVEMMTSRQDARKALLRTFYEATKSGDQDAMQDAQQAIREFNERQPADRVKPSDLAASVKQRDKRTQEMQGGLRVGKRDVDTFNRLTGQE